MLNRKNEGTIKHLVKAFESVGKKIDDLNDHKGWTFEQFAGKARELGL